MSKQKKMARHHFNEVCINRDKVCMLCGRAGTLEVHHITNRNKMPNGGYVKENGISLCPKDHKLIETLGEELTAVSLYGKINSSYLKAYHASLKL